MDNSRNDYIFHKNTYFHLYLHINTFIFSDEDAESSEDEDDSPYIPPRFLPHKAKLRRPADKISSKGVSAIAHDDQTSERPCTPPQFLPRTSTKLHHPVGDRHGFLPSASTENVHLRNLQERVLQCQMSSLSCSILDVFVTQEYSVLMSTPIQANLRDNLPGSDPI